MFGISRFGNLSKHKFIGNNRNKTTQKKILKNSKHLIRLDYTDPIKALNYSLKIATPPSLFAQVEEVNKLWDNFTNFHPENNIMLTTWGVRASLNILFCIAGMCDYKIMIPNDVYPVYRDIALQYNNFDMYTSANKSINEILGNYNDKICILMTIPHVTTGKTLTDEDTLAIIQWLNGNKDRIIIIDAVYAYNNSLYLNHFFTLFKTQQVIICSSLSRVFLLPLHYGVIYLPKKLSYWQDIINIKKPDADLLGIAKDVIQMNPDFPKYQKDLFRFRWNKLSSLIKSIYPEWEAPENGYLSTLPIKCSELYKKYNILAIPSDLYSSHNIDCKIEEESYSIISCLYDKDASGVWSRINVANSWKMT